MTGIILYVDRFKPRASAWERENRYATSPLTAGMGLGIGEEDAGRLTCPGRRRRIHTPRLACPSPSPESSVARGPHPLPGLPDDPSVLISWSSTSGSYYLARGEKGEKSKTGTDDELRMSSPPWRRDSDSRAIVYDETIKAERIIFRCDHWFARSGGRRDGRDVLRLHSGRYESGSGQR